MATREVSINATDIAALERELKEKADSLSSEQKQFASYLVKRSKEGQSAAPKPADWLWTYNF